MENYHIAIDGIDGSGKTTQAQMLFRHLEGKGIKVFYTKFTPFASKALLDISLNLSKSEGSVRKHFSLSHLEYVYACDEYLNFTEIIKPKIKNGFCVIQDRSKVTRYVNSIIANSPKIDIKKILKSIPNPDLTIILSVNPEIASLRLDLRGNRKEDDNFHYLELASKLYQNLNIKITNLNYVDGSKSIDVIHSNILNLLSEKLGI